MQAPTSGLQAQTSIFLIKYHYLYLIKKIKKNQVPGLQAPRCRHLHLLIQMQAPTWVLNFFEFLSKLDCRCLQSNHVGTYIWLVLLGHGWLKVTGRSVRSYSALGQVRSDHIELQVRLDYSVLSTSLHIVGRQQPPIQGLRFKIQGLGLGFGFGFKVQGLEFRLVSIHTHP